MVNILQETLPLKYTLSESKEGKMIIRGEYAKLGVPTANGRMYTEEIYRPVIERLQESIKRRRLFGEADHPGDSRTKITRVSHVTTYLGIEDGSIIGESELLDTPNGKILQVLAKAGCEFGVSSRATGSVINKKGIDEVQGDFNLRAFDFVIDPADKDAYPKVFMESEEGPSIEEMRADYPDLVSMIEEAIKEDAKKAFDSSLEGLLKQKEEEVRANMTEMFEKNVLSSLVEAKEDIRKEVTESVQNDPIMSGAKGVLSRIAEMTAEFYQKPDVKAVKDALKAKDIEVAGYRSKMEEAVKLAKNAAYQLHMDRKIAGCPMAETIRRLVDIEACESVEKLDEQIGAILEDLEPFISRDREAKEKVASDQMESLKTENERLKSDLMEVKKRLEKSVETSQKLKEESEESESRINELTETVVELEEALAEAKVEKELKVKSLREFKRERVEGLENSDEVLSLLENVDDVARAENVVARHGRAKMSDPELERIRNRVRRGTAISESEDNIHGGGSGSVDRKIFGVSSINEIQQLSGK